MGRPKAGTVGAVRAGAMEVERQRWEVYEIKEREGIQKGREADGSDRTWL